MGKKECMIRESEDKEGLGVFFPFFCRLGACSLSKLDSIRLTLAAGDADIISAIESKAAPECVLNQSGNERVTVPVIVPHNGEEAILYVAVPPDFVSEDGLDVFRPREESSGLASEKTDQPSKAAPEGPIDSEK